jgi:hypothetical protein
LDLRIVKFSAQQPLKAKKCPFDIGHLTRLRRNADLSLLLAKGDVARRVAQRIVICNCFNAALPGVTTQFKWRILISRQLFYVKKNSLQSSVGDRHPDPTFHFDAHSNP